MGHELKKRKEENVPSIGVPLLGILKINNLNLSKLIIKIQILNKKKKKKLFTERK
jgi:hypothetical protein